MNQKKTKGCGVSAIFAVIGIISLVVAFFFLIRGCLSKWDSFGSVGWPGITNDQTTLVIVKSYSKTQSYSNQGGMVHKSYSTTYYLEQIDLATGELKKKKKLISQSRIKKGALNCWGGFNDLLWVYANGIKAYNMKTLELEFKEEDIETKNPQLKGKLPTEQQYYDAHINLGYITITALDGDKYNLFLTDMKAMLIDPDMDNPEKFEDMYKEQRELVNKKIDSLNGLVYDHSNYNKYQQLLKEREVYYKQRDSIDRLKENAREDFQDMKSLIREQEGFSPWSSSRIDNWLINKDTFNRSAFVLDKDMPSNSNFDLTNYSSLGNESQKVNLFKLGLEVNPESHSSYDKFKVTKVEKSGDLRFLQGGILRSYHTARAYHLKDPDGYIIFSRDIIGKDAKLLVTRVSLDGKQIWQTNALMSFDVKFADVTKDYLIITGIINQDKAPSFSVNDALRIIDLKSGNLISVKY